ncbi:MAG: ABC transporter substrate-binding protein [Candidatus Rokubacteria bacterium]|nr:ABC transporter substrate-binding protein [Candidatus Rokubacteria bacterium]
MNGKRHPARVAAVLFSLFAAVLLAVAPADAAPEGQMTWAVHTTLVPAWFDPADMIQQTPFMVLYATHDALVKPMPGNRLTPSLAESWSVSPDGLVYDFVLRKGVKFHNGDPVTAEDAKFSFERYRGIFAKTLKERVVAIETPDPGRIRFRLKQPWPDFMTFYGGRASGAGWVVPKKYVERVGDEGYKKAPIGSGPYKFVSFTPGIELVLEANEQYWRKQPHVKRLVFRTVPDHATRVAALKRGDADVIYLVSGEMAQDVRRTPGLAIKAVFPSNHWLILADQFDPKSPWHDQRVRLAANLAIDRKTLNEAATLGLSKVTWSIVPASFDFYWQPPAYPHDPARAKRLLAEAGHPNGFDAGDFSCDLQVCPWGEAMVNDLKAVGIRLKLRALERATFFKGAADKKIRGVVYLFFGSTGNAATWLESYAVTGGTYAYGGFPDIDGLFREQATELDRGRREAALHKIQQLIHERAMFIPIWDFAFLHGVGPRVEESGLGLLAPYGFSAPYEEVKLKGR